MGLTHLLDAVVHFCYPPRCLKCETGHEGPGALCPGCDGTLKGLEQEPACWRCGMPIPHQGGPCPYCLGKGMAHYEWIFRLGVYREPLRDLVHHLKYSRRWSLAEQLADRLLQQESVRDVLAVTDVAVPVPLHYRRQFERGYNQAEVLAQQLCRGRKIKVISPLVRVKHTPTQTRLSREQREANLRGAFALVDGKGVMGKRVLVVDDVMTTGATLRAVARTLKEAAPASLNALVIAVADPKGRDFEAI